MTLIGGVFPPPDWVPATVPNTRQLIHQARKFGVFPHYGPGTFSDQEWTDPTFQPSSYAPTSQPDPSQWVASAKAIGAAYIFGIFKHHEGFTMWNSADTSYGINSPGSGSTFDVMAALATACQEQGIKLAAYYSLWDRTRNPNTSNPALDAAYNSTVISHLTEIFSNYGPVCELWLDGGWEKAPARWNLRAIYKLFREKQPLGVMAVNQTIGDPSVAGFPNAYHPDAQVAGDPIKYAPSDYRSWDTIYTRSGTPGVGGESNADPKTFSSNGRTYFLPIETPITINTGDKWFWHDSSTDTSFQTIPYLAGAYMRSTGQGNNFVLNIPPNKAGVFSSACVDHINALAAALGMGSGLPVVDLAEGKFCTASTEFSPTYAASKATTGQVRGGPRWASAGGDTNNPFIYVDLGTTTMVSRIAMKEWYDASANPITRLTAFSVQTSLDAVEWNTQSSGSGTSAATDESGETSFQWVVKNFDAVLARYVRIIFTEVTNPPTINSLRVY